MLAIIILGIVILLVIVASVGSRNSNTSNHNTTTTSKTIRCPNCGSQATVKGDHWECGWCGDYGSLR